MDDGHGPDFYMILRPVMFTLGMITTWHAWMIGDPTWVVVVFAMAGAIFMLRPGGLWELLNPLISLAYVVHAFWLGWLTFA